MRNAHRHLQTLDAGPPSRFFAAAASSQNHTKHDRIRSHCRPISSSCFCVILSAARDLARSASRYASMARKKRIPPLHPGKVLYEDFTRPTGISVHRLAMDLRVPANRIAEIVKGERAVSADTTLRLSRYLGTSPEFWLALQSDYDLEKAKDELKAKI